MSDEDRYLWQHVIRTVTPLSGKDKAAVRLPPEDSPPENGPDVNNLNKNLSSSNPGGHSSGNECKSPPLACGKKTPQTNLPRGTQESSDNDTGPRIPPTLQHALKRPLPFFGPQFKSENARSSSPSYPAGESTGKGRIDRRTMQKLKRGRFPIEGRLDLHGMNQEDSRSAVNNFLRSARLSGKRCVLIITGKGRSQSVTAERSLHSSGLTAKTSYTPVAQVSSGILRKRLPQWLESTQMQRDILSYCHARPQDGGEGAFYVLLRRKDR